MGFAELDREAHTQTDHETGWVLQKANEGSSRSSVQRPEGGPRLGALHREVSIHSGSPEVGQSGCPWTDAPPSRFQGLICPCSRIPSLGRHSVTSVA